MNPTQARDLIRNTFPKAFDKPHFRNFAINLLNHIDESKAQPWSNQYVKHAFKDHVQRYERLGTYTCPDNEKLDVLVVYLTTESTLERARTAIRNFVADHLKTRDEKEAALVAFVSPTEKQWRFSYVKMEYAAVEKDSDKAGPEQNRKVGVETRLTPARRFSYIVGEGESCHTAQTRFLDLLQDTATDPTLAQIEEAFSVEAVTKEFFTKYAKLFGDINAALEKLVAKDKTLRDEFNAKGIKTVDFAKKLMGQIVFLYFLQKKGWLGVEKGKDWGTGPRNFLRRLVSGTLNPENPVNPVKNIFNDILEHLFYDTLATDRGHEAWCDRFKCRIPFLNGGLFEPLGDYDWEDTDIILPNELFTNGEFVEEGITGTGVLDVFDRYNFTVNEAEPLEKEVAIDPEMLGKVFENLIEDNRRKGLGAYYTPREIVHYMCQESLINYLDTAVNTAEESLTPKKPKQARLFGAPEAEQTTLKTTVRQELVPRADIETFVRLGEQISHYESVEAQYAIKMPKSIQNNAKALDDALKAITVCDPAVGSGAFPVGMMTEIVHARATLTPYFNDVFERTPYHFKRHAIQNCLYGVDIDSSAVEIAKLRLWLSLVVDEEDVKQIKPLPNLDYKIVAGNSLMGFPFKSQRLKAIENLKQHFFDECDHTKRATLKEMIDRKLRDCFEASKKSLGCEVTFDFELYFSEVFHSKGGFDVVIGNPPYVSYGLRGGQTLTKEDKNFLKTAFPNSAEYKISLYALFMEKGIKLCHQDGGINAFIVPDSFVLGMYFSKIRSFILHNCLMNNILLLPFSVFKAVVGFSVVYQFERRRKVLDSFLFTARTAPTSYAIGRREFKEHAYPQQYFHSQKRSKFRLFFDGYSKALIENCVKGAMPLESVVSFRSGLIGKGGQDSIVSKTQISAKWRPGIISGGEIRRYEIMPEGNHLLYDRNAIKSGYECVEYFKPKLFMRQTGDSLVCAYDDQGLLCLNNVHVGNAIDKTVPLKFVVALLNSKLLNWFYQTIALEVGRMMPQTDIETLDDLPMRTGSGQQNLILIVDQILTAKRRNPGADTKALESEIDQLVYKLYGLTPEEIKIVEINTRR